MASPTGVSLGEWVVLALLAEAPAHGFALARLLSPQGEIGRVWTLSRPLTYRALEQLRDKGLAVVRGVEPGAGPARTLFTPTRAGRTALRRWLHAPIEHIREVRSALLVKVLLCGRAGLPIAPLVAAQQEALSAVLAALRSGPADDPIALWRRESAEAVARFLAGLADLPPSSLKGVGA